MRQDKDQSLVHDSETPDDIVTPEWLNSHAIRIPRAEGVFKSPTAWVRVSSTGAIIAAGPIDQHVITWLVEQGILSGGDVDYAIAYVTCRDAHRAFRKERGYKSSLDITAAGSSLSCEQAARVFSLVRRDLGTKYCQIIEYACDTLRTAGTPGNYRPPYQAAFKALAQAFRDAIEAVRADQD